MITKETLERLVEDQFFTVEFIKKDGTLRRMNCRLGVTKHLRGGESTVAYLPHLVPVYDMKAKAYRVINLKTLVSITADGMHYAVRPTTVAP